MVSKVQIFNRALTEAGGRPTVLDPDEGSEGAILCRNNYDLTLDEVLRAHPWNFAKRRQQLAAKGSSPLFEFGNCFALPSDPFCLRFLNANTELSVQVEGRDLLTDAAAPLQIAFIARVEDPELFDPLFASALALNLANVIAPKLNRKESQEKRIWDKYLQKLSLARSIDGMEGTPVDPQTDAFLNARL